MVMGRGYSKHDFQHEPVRPFNLGIVPRKTLFTWRIPKMETTTWVLNWYENESGLAVAGYKISCGVGVYGCFSKGQETSCQAIFCEQFPCLMNMKAGKAIDQVRDTEMT
jgi:hypothetical protein